MMIAGKYNDEIVIELEFENDEIINYQSKEIDRKVFEELLIGTSDEMLIFDDWTVPKQKLLLAIYVLKELNLELVCDDDVCVPKYFPGAGNIFEVGILGNYDDSEDDYVRNINSKQEIEEIKFFVGGYFGPNDVIVFRKAKNECYYVELYHSKDRREKTEVSLCRKVESDEWNKLINKIFDDVGFLKWEKSYYDPNVRDGEQWFLEVELTNGKYIITDGSNAYPPNWKKLKSIIRKYFKEANVEFVAGG